MVAYTQKFCVLDIAYGFVLEGISKSATMSFLHDRQV